MANEYVHTVRLLSYSPCCWAIFSGAVFFAFFSDPRVSVSGHNGEQGEKNKEEAERNKEQESVWREVQLQRLQRRRLQRRRHRGHWKRSQSQHYRKFPVRIWVWGFFSRRPLHFTCGLQKKIFFFCNAKLNSPKSNQNLHFGFHSQLFIQRENTTLQERSLDYETNGYIACKKCGEVIENVS